jgi:hypothetical protein
VTKTSLANATGATEASLAIAPGATSEVGVGSTRVTAAVGVGASGASPARWVEAAMVQILGGSISNNYFITTSMMVADGGVGC